MARFDTLFLDIGGVMLSNGWDHQERENAANRFKLDVDDLQNRHKEYSTLLETDQMTLDEYLEKVVFWKERDFSREEFRDFIFSQSKPFPEMLRLFAEFKRDFGFNVAAVSNEGRDLANFRIKTFQLGSFIDHFFISCYIGYQKPDPRLIGAALDVLQVNSHQVIYIDDRPNFIAVAEKLGVFGIVHTSYESTKKQLYSLSAE